MTTYLFRVSVGLLIRPLICYFRYEGRSTSAESILSCSHTSARLALQKEILPGSVKSGSLESLLQGLGGVQLKYVNIDSEAENDHMTDHMGGHMTNSELIIEDIEDYDLETLCNQSEALSYMSSGPITKPRRPKGYERLDSGEGRFSRNEFVNQCYTQGSGYTQGWESSGESHNSTEIGFYNKGIPMGVFSRQHDNGAKINQYFRLTSHEEAAEKRNSVDSVRVAGNVVRDNPYSKSKRQNESAKNNQPANKGFLNTRDQGQGQGQSSPRGQGHRYLSPLQRRTPERSSAASSMLSETSFISRATSSGYGSISTHLTPASANLQSNKTSHTRTDNQHTSPKPVQDYSQFVTQPDRERVSNRGRDMTVFMYIIGGKDSPSQNLTIKPLNVWKLEIF